MIYVINMLIGMKAELGAREILGEYEVNSITGRQPYDENAIKAFYIWFCNVLFPIYDQYNEIPIRLFQKWREEATPKLLGG